jgi:hypothetical protein
MPKSGNEGIGTDPGERAYGIECRRRGVRAVLPATPPRYAHLGMQATLPVDHEHDLARRAIDVDDDLMDQRTHDTLAQTGICIVVLPEFLKTLGER